MKKGDIVLVPFPFTDLSGAKTRPAIVLTSSEDDVVLCFLTTQIGWQNKNDILLSPSDENGLKKKSLIRTSNITTLDKNLILGKLGVLEKRHVFK